jgi:hypothetical protein
MDLTHVEFGRGYSLAETVIAICTEIFGRTTRDRARSEYEQIMIGIPYETTIHYQWTEDIYSLNQWHILLYSLLHCIKSPISDGYACYIFINPQIV